MRLGLQGIQAAILHGPLPSLHRRDGSPYNLDDLADFPDERRALDSIKGSIEGFFSIMGQVDQAVRDKLASYSQAKVPGSREWEILYQKFYAEELARRKW